MCQKNRIITFTAMGILKIYWDYYFASNEKLFKQICSAEIY
jgi:hypothetical protein